MIQRQLYECLPYAYIGGAVFGTIVTDFNPVGLISSALLLGMGLYILKKRHDARERRRHLGLSTSPTRW